MAAAETPLWLIQIDEFADALNERARQRSEPFYRIECKNDVEYMKKAARLLKVMTVAYSNLSNQVNAFYTKEQKLTNQVEEVVEIVQNQIEVLPD